MRLVLRLFTLELRAPLVALAGAVAAGLAAAARVPRTWIMVLRQPTAVPWEVE